MSSCTTDACHPLFESSPPDTSLIISAPYSSIAIFATIGRKVSTEMMTSENAWRTALNAILRRAVSSSSVAMMPPGRVEHAPMSTIVPPSLSICSTRWHTARSVCTLDAAKNESGVTFRIPITTGSERSISRPPTCIIVFIRAKIVIFLWIQALNSTFLFTFDTKYGKYVLRITD